MFETLVLFCKQNILVFFILIYCCPLSLKFKLKSGKKNSDILKNLSGKNWKFEIWKLATYWLSDVLAFLKYYNIIIM